MLSKFANSLGDVDEKIALGISYDGSRYFGWQKQQAVQSIQAELEQALSTVANEPIEIFVPEELTQAYTPPVK